MCFDEDGEKGGGVTFILKKKALLLAFIYMNMIFETWLFQQDRIQRDVSQLRGPQTRKLHGVHTSFISVCHLQWG